MAGMGKQRTQKVTKMSKTYVIWVPGEPVAKSRPRVYHGRGITPKKTKEAEEQVARAFHLQYPNAIPLKGPIAIKAEFWLSRQGRPDWDNLVKLATDALNGIAYEDDAQIVQAVVHKITPDLMMPGKRGVRRRKTGDPLTHHGTPYEPHTVLTITQAKTNKNRKKAEL